MYKTDITTVLVLFKSETVYLRLGLHLHIISIHFFGMF